MGICPAGKSRAGEIIRLVRQSGECQKMVCLHRMPSLPLYVVRTDHDQVRFYKEEPGTAGTTCHARLLFHLQHYHTDITATESLVCQTIMLLFLAPDVHILQHVIRLFPAVGPGTQEKALARQQLAERLSILRLCLQRDQIWRDGFPAEAHRWRRAEQYPEADRGKIERQPFLAPGLPLREPAG